MLSDTAPPTLVPDRRLAVPGGLHLSDLNRAERLVICALRAGNSQQGREGVAIAEHERDDVRELRRFVERYLHRHTPFLPARASDPADTRLSPFECHTLHALACLQAGLLGEAWKSLVTVWGSAEAGKALVRLQEVADALQLRDARVERWHFDASFFREAALI